VVPVCDGKDERKRDGRRPSGRKAASCSEFGGRWRFVADSKSPAKAGKPGGLPPDSDRSTECFLRDGDAMVCETLFRSGSRQWMAETGAFPVRGSAVVNITRCCRGESVNRKSSCRPGLEDCLLTRNSVYGRAVRSVGSVVELGRRAGASNVEEEPKVEGTRQAAAAMEESLGRGLANGRGNRRRASVASRRSIGE